MSTTNYESAFDSLSDKYGDFKLKYKAGKNPKDKNGNWILDENGESILSEGEWTLNVHGKTYKEHDLWECIEKALEDEE